MSNDVVVVTCVTNAAGMGPGHSAVAVGTLLYTFEALDYGGSGSGWKTLDRDSYFASNTYPLPTLRIGKAAKSDDA